MEEDGRKSAPEQENRMRHDPCPDHGEYDDLHGLLINPPF